MTPRELTALRALEPLCWRAPSAHNTQPWTLTYHDDRVAVGWDPARALPMGDPDGRDLRLSLGAFVETCLIAAADASLAIAFAADHDTVRRRVGWLVAAQEPYATPFGAAVILRRTTSRAPYHAEPLPGGLLAALRSIATGVGGDVRLLDPAELAPLVSAADRHLFDTPPVLRELRSWLRLSSHHPRYELDGLTDRTLELRRAETLALRAVLSRGAYPVLRRTGLARLAAAAAAPTPGGSVLALVGPAGCPPEAEVAFGRALQRMWLLLADRGLATHPLSQVIDAPHTRRELHSLLGLPPGRRVLNLARVGRPLRPAPRSARRRGRPGVAGGARPAARR